MIVCSRRKLEKEEFMEENIIRKTVYNGDTEIEYYRNNQVNEKASLIISMGIWEPADRALPLIARLTGRHCIVLSYRGRGGSGTPLTGYDWSHHGSDLACVLKNEETNKPVFLGFSKGVSYMLGYLSANAEAAHGVIIIDYPAIHSKLGKGAAQFWSNMIYNGSKLDKYVNELALEGIEKESTYTEFYDYLSQIKCPVWVFRGMDTESGVPSNLTEDDMLKFKSYIKDLQIIDFKHSGHMILDEELGKAAGQIRRIIDRIDEGIF